VAILSEHAPTKITTSYNPDCPSDFDEEAIKRIFGEPKKVNIYTGNILFVGESVHLEHDINTFTRCAGAIIFLLDKYHPFDPPMSGIAVHVGSYPTLRTKNLGFKINQVPTIY
jgi:hypothetical protein